MLESLTFEDFARHLNETFRIRQASGSLDVELVAAEPRGEARDGHRRPFSVVLRGPQEPILEQRIYGLEHPEMGTLEVFLVPIGPDDTGQRYELVFS